MTAAVRTQASAEGSTPSGRSLASVTRAPAELRARPQWVAWRREPRDGRPTKVPYNAKTGALASTIDPATWTTFDEAVAFCTSHPDMTGVGYVLGANDPYVGVDLDHCLDGFSEELEPWARAIVDALDSYTEITPSGEGLRIFVRGSLPPSGRKRGNVEMYAQARFLTITGQHLAGCPTAIEDRGEALLRVHADVFGKAEPTPTNGTTHVVAREPLLLADAELLRTARAASNGAAFWSLWNGDWSGYGSRSEADLALCSHLAFYAQGDAARVDGLFRQSGLMRAKWDQRRGDATYGARTIEKALSGLHETYSGPSGRLEASGGTSTPYTVDPATGEVLTEPAASPWQSLNELVQTVPETQRQIVEGLFWQGRTHWLYSAPSVGKTLFSLAAWMHVAAGRPFGGRPVIQGPVLLIEEDSPHAVVAEYVQTLADVYDFDLESMPFWINRIQGLRVTDEAGLESVWNLIQAAPEPPLILGIDACERVVPSDKFNSRELDPLSQLLQRCLHRLITPAVIDHTRKSGGGTQTPPPDPLDMLYGGRSKSAISDVMLHFSGSIRTSARLTFTKFRGPVPPPVDIKFDPADGFTVATQPRQLTEFERRAIAALNNYPGRDMPKDDLLAAIGASRRTGERVLAGLVGDHLLETDGGTKQGSRFRLSYLAPGVFQ